MARTYESGPALWRRCRQLGHRRRGTCKQAARRAVSAGWLTKRNRALGGPKPPGRVGGRGSTPDWRLTVATSAAHVGPRLTEWTVAVAAVLCAAALGGALAVETTLAVPLLAVGALLTVQVLGWRGLVVAMIAATFVTRYRIAVFGINFRPEHFFAVALGISLILHGKTAALARAASDRTALLLSAFIVWQVFVSLLRSPDPAASLTIVGWLALDWIILVVCLAAISSPERLQRVGVALAVASSAIALGFWTASLLHVSDAGTQITGFGAARSAYGLSWEANILASTIALWTFVGLSAKRRTVQRLATRYLPLLALALAATFTRAAALGLAGGLLIWAVFSGQIARHRAARVGVVIAVGAAALSLSAASVVSPIAAKLGTAFEVDQGNGAYRLNVAEQALADMRPTDYLTGLGTSSFSQRHTDYSRPGQDIPGYLGALPLQVLYDSGIIGVGLLSLVVASLRPFRRPDRGRSLGLLTVYLVCATATSPFWFGTTWLLVALGVLTRPGRHRAAASSG